MLSSKLSRSIRRVQLTRAWSTMDMRTYSQYTLYKENAALVMKPLSPAFAASGSNARKVLKNGSMYFEFALASEAVQDSKYDWSRKSAVALSVSECGDILLLKRGETEAAAFYRTDADKSKQMHWEPSADGQGT
jgi:hypothetical protein